MGKYIGTILIVSACVVVLLIGSLRRKSEWLLNIILRGVLGTISIYFINQILSAVNISIEVGINPITILTSGILGFPGVLALYGIGIYRLLA